MTRGVALTLALALAAMATLLARGVTIPALAVFAITALALALRVLWTRQLTETTRERIRKRQARHSPSYANIVTPRWRETLDPAMREFLRPLHVIAVAEDSQRSRIQEGAPQDVRLLFVEVPKPRARPKGTRSTVWPPT